MSPILGVIASGVTKPTVTGGTLTSDATFYYRTFTSNGTLAVSNGSITADCLVIAGGGGSGVSRASNTGAAGGGGAGGLNYQASQTLNTSYSITIGGGGASQTSGSNTTFDSLITATGGGRGAGTTGNTSNESGSAGGSGGGGKRGTTSGTSSNGGAGTSGQGFKGGGVVSGQDAAGGGGGATAVGGNGVGAGGAGDGGPGSSAYSSWGSVTSTGKLSGGTYYYATGGPAIASFGINNWQGGSTPAGGDITSATANTGNGIRANSNGTGNAGASGIVIVRYTKAQVD